MSRPGADLALLLLGGFRALAEAASEELAARGHPKIRPVHDFAIRAIDGGADTTAQLATLLGVSKQAASKTVGFLEERGYITSEPDPRDTRRHRFAVTDAGHDLLRTGEQVFDELRDRWAQRIGERELGRLEDALAELGVRVPSQSELPAWLADTAG